MKKLFAITCTTALCLLSVVCCAIGAETATSQNASDPTITQTETATATDADPRSTTTTGEPQETQIDAPVVVTTEEESWEPTTTTVRQISTTLANKESNDSYTDFVITKRYPVKVTLTENEKYRMAKLVFGEAGGEPFIYQQAVASIILNSMEVENRSFEAEMSARNRYEAYPSCLSKTPTQKSIDAVNDILENGRIFPLGVLYFQEGDYSDYGWGKDKPYCQMGHSYISYNSDVGID